MPSAAYAVSGNRARSPRRLIAGLAVCLLLVAMASGVACGDGREEDETPTAPAVSATPGATAAPTVQPTPVATRSAATATATTTAVPTPTPTPNFPHIHDPSVRTGIPGVDAVIDAALSRDVDALVDRTATFQAPCFDEPPPLSEGPYYARCQHGEAVGTLVDVFPYGQCQGFMIRDLRGFSGAFVDQVWGLYAVVRAPAPALPDRDPLVFMPLGDYWVTFASPAPNVPVERSGPLGYSLHVTEQGTIVAALWGCHAASFFLQSGGEPLEQILAPPVVP